MVFPDSMPADNDDRSASHGEDLASLLRRIGRLPKDKAIEIVREICAGVGATHALGVVHRDLKSANVMIDGRGRARVADFGLAGAIDELVAAAIRFPTAIFVLIIAALTVFGIKTSTDQKLLPSHS
jgi:serine/threonine protein kinase